MGKRVFLIGAGALVALFVLLGSCGVSTYNTLVSLNSEVDAQWANLQSAYQRRVDLIPNLVATVKGAASFERETITAVTEARSRVGQLSATASDKILSDPEAFRRYQQAQDQLSSSLSRLLVVAERYPELRATQNFRDLQAQLEGTENRISVERRRFNEAARQFNVKRNSFPTTLLAGFFGDRFRPRSYFEAQAGAETAPKVQF
jgi:LemA protein